MNDITDLEETPPRRYPIGGGLDPDTLDAVQFAIAELFEARRQHPQWPDDPVHAAAILAKELGALQESLLEHIYEAPKRQVPNRRIHKEAEQTAAMALRFLANCKHYKFTS